MNKNLLAKVAKYRTNEKSLDNRIDILEELILNSQLEKEQLDLIIGENNRLDDDFFEAFESLNKIRELDSKFKESITPLIIGSVS